MTGAKGHAKLSPSASKRWINCPGSVRLSEGIPERSSVFAEEGSAAHALAEKCYLKGFNVHDMLGGFISAKDDVIHAPGKEKNHKPGVAYFEITPEMVEAVDMYLLTLKSATRPGDETDVELRVYLTEDIYGTADFVRYRPSTGELFVADFKYGANVPVDPRENTQAIIYALGAAKAKGNRGVSTIEIVIVQPRCPSKEGPVRRWVVEPCDLLDWEVDIVDAAAVARSDDAPLRVGEWCKFCPVGVCPKAQEAALAEAVAEFGPGYDPAALAHALSVVGSVEDWCRRVREFAHAEATDGRIPPGYKLVASRATRRWKDESAVTAHLELEMGVEPEDMRSTPTLLSPAKIETVLGKKYGFKAKAAKEALASFVESVSSGTVLAPEDDARPSAYTSAAEEFS